MAFKVIIIFSISKESSTFTKLSNRNARLKFRRGFNTRLCIFIPKVEMSIRSTGGECALLWMKTDVINREDLIILAMTFKEK
jgi:hypothetical protein